MCIRVCVSFPLIFLLVSFLFRVTTYFVDFIHDRDYPVKSASNWSRPRYSFPIHFRHRPTRCSDEPPDRRRSSSNRERERERKRFSRLCEIVASAARTPKTGSTAGKEKENDDRATVTEHRGFYELQNYRRCVQVEKVCSLAVDPSLTSLVAIEFAAFATPFLRTVSGGVSRAPFDSREGVEWCF